MSHTMICDISSRIKTELRALENRKFLGFIKITDIIILPTFDFKGSVLIVTPPEYEMKVCGFVDERNKPGSPSSDVNCYVNYMYLVKHWR